MQDGKENGPMTEQTRSIRRLVLGIFSIVLGVVSLVAFFSVTYIAGIAILGGFYGLIFIAIGVGLILPKMCIEYFYPGLAVETHGKTTVFQNR